MTKLKILMINYEFPPIGGGAAKATQCILKEYAKIGGLKVDVLTSSPQPGFFQEQFAQNINIYKVGLHKKGLHYWRKIEVIEWLLKAGRPYRELLRQNNYDLAHTFFAFPSGYFCYKTSKRLPYIISLRGSDVPGYNVRLGLDYKLCKGLFRKIWRSASAVVANSDGLKKLALEFMPKLEISVIPNGIDTKKFYPAADKSIGGRINLLTVSRLISRKRVDMLIEATAVLKSMGIDVVLNIAGQGNLMESLKALSGRLNISDAVKFLGRVRPEEMPQLYRDNDIFVMSSRHEGMSNAMLEAMASGLPIVTTQCEGLDELIDDNGIIVKEPTSRTIACAIQDISNNGARYKTMSNAARTKAEHFSWGITADLYLNLYRQLLNKISEQKYVSKPKSQIANRLELLLNAGASDRLQNFDVIEKDPEKILVATSAGIGDTTMAAPAIKKLKDKFPQASIIALAQYNRGSHKVFDLMPCIDETIDFPIANYKWSGVIRYMLGKFWILLFKLRSRNIDLAVFLMPNIIRRFLLAGMKAKKWLYGKRIDDYPGEIAFEVMEPLQINRDKSGQVFKVPTPENSEKILPGKLQRPIIGVHPFCGIRWKEWYKFDELSERLRSTRGTVVVIGKQDGYAAPDGVIDLVSRTSLCELFWVISRLDLLITADSGPMHIGFALDIPTVALFGFVPPRFLVSKSAYKNHKIIYKPVAGIVPPTKVRQREKLDNSAMQSITVDEVIQASAELLERRGLKLEQRA